MPLELTAVPTLIVGLAVALVGYLLSRSIRQLDEKLDKQDAKLDALGNKDAQHSEGILELRLRVGHLEAEQAAMRDRHTDFAGFLQTMGFKKRDG